MKMYLTVKIPQELIHKTSIKMNEIPCLRKEVVFELFPEDKWGYHFSCWGFGNGYGVICACRENCSLRITDLKKCRNHVSESGYLYKVQDEFFNNSDHR